MEVNNFSFCRFPALTVDQGARLFWRLARAGEMMLYCFFFSSSMATTAAMEQTYHSTSIDSEALELPK
jgi:hypothetical protein